MRGTVREKLDVLVVVDFEEGDGGVSGVGGFAVVGEVEAEEIVPEVECGGHVGDVVGDVGDAGDVGASGSGGLGEER